MKEGSKNQQSHHLFRLAAVLYADNNYELKPETIHRKVIESVFLETKNTPLTSHGIIDYIEDNYGITFDEMEVEKIITNNSENFITERDKRGGLFVSLTPNRKQTLDKKVSSNTIDSFIELFISEQPKLAQKMDVKAIIQRFLYDKLNANISAIKQLLNKDVKARDLISDKHNYSVEEFNVINGFLTWNNDEKDKAVFNVISYALEYCMLTNEAVPSHDYLSGLKNKIFYLDTNIIYRALGINGEGFKKRTITFIKKFSEVGGKLKISEFTEKEFREGIQARIDRVNLYPSKRVNPEILNLLKGDVFSFYQKWRTGRSNDSLNLFKSYIFGQYDELRTAFNIEQDYKTPFDVKDDGTKTILSKFTEAISDYKEKRLARHYYGSDYADACNIYLLKKRRNGKSINLFDTKYFFVSTDQCLQDWDYGFSETIPNVIHPGQWMSILLRYVSRTNDDYKSFISFINLKNNASHIDVDNTTLGLIVSGVSEIAEDFEQQKFIVATLIQDKFKHIISSNTKENVIYERSKKAAESILSERVKQLEQDSEKTKKQLQQITSDKDSKLNKTSAQNKSLISILANELAEKEVRKFRRPAYWLLFVGFVLIIFLAVTAYFHFSQSRDSYNYVYWLSNRLEQSANDTLKQLGIPLLYALFYVLPSTVLWFIIKFCWKRFSVPKADKVKEFSIGIEQDLTNK